MLKKGQVWIETVIYTLIGLTVIALILSFARPKIEEIRDKAVIDQTIESFNNIDKIISDIMVSSGNSRLVLFSLRKGDLNIDGENDEIRFVLENSKSVYSEPDKQISLGKLYRGNLYVKTSGDEAKTVEVWLDYSNLINLKYDEKEENKALEKASTPYRIFFENTGNAGGLSNINVKII